MNAQLHTEPQAFYSSGHRPFIIRAAAILIIILLISLQAIAQTGKTFIVNTLGDAEDFNEFDNVCDVDANQAGEQCTFRAAIQNHNANRHLDHNFIRFEIPNAPGTGSIVIKVGSTGLGALPSILGAVTIAGSNRVGADGPSRRIELDGIDAGAGAIGLELLGEDCDISFFIINSFGSHGMHLAGTQFSNGGHKISLMMIGTDSTGTEDKGNGGDGIFIEDVPDNLIGGTSLLEGNVIAGNGGYGINILGRDPDSTGFPLGGARGNKLFHNFIGIDRFESVILPNDSGGVLIDNAREILVGEVAATPPAIIGNVGVQQAQGKGNTIAGEKNGITVKGSLSKGVRLEANTIGKDGTVAKLFAGIFARPGELFSATGNIITNIGEASMDLFFDVNSRYVIKDQQINTILKAGTVIKFAENRVITVEYRNNSHVGVGVGATTGLTIEESLRGTINWVLDSNFSSNCQTGARITFRSSGEKNLTNNRWNFNAGAGIEYMNEFAQGAVAKITVSNEFAVGNGTDGFFGRMELDATADITVNMVKLFGNQNGKDGLSIALRATAGAKAIFNIGGESEFIANGSLAARLVGSKASIDIFKIDVSKTSAKDNIEGAFYLFDVKLKFSLTENIITGNGGPGVRLGGSSDVRIDGNSISGNAIGILTEEDAIATIGNNTLTANGKAVVLTGNGVGTPLTANSIFNNIGLGVDLNNDGVTPNDTGDGDAGPNNLQNYPVLTSASSAGGNTIINGSLNSTPNTNFRIEFFSNTVCNSSGFGEGENFLGFDSVTTDAAGNVSFAITLNGVMLPGGSFVTATATDAANNTSEFSACRLAGSAQAADLELIKQADKTQLNVGDEVTFTIRLINEGPDAATNITVKDVAPAGLTFTEVTAASGTYDEITGIWTVNSIASGDEAGLTIKATATREGIIENIAEIMSSSQPDPDSSPGNGIEDEDDLSSVSVNVVDVDLSPAQQIQLLIARINDLIETDQLGERQGERLIRDLEKALREIERGNSKKAIFRLVLFIVRVEKLIHKGDISETEGEALIAAARNIIEQLVEEVVSSSREQDAVADFKELPDFRLLGNYPNPFNASTRISFELAKESMVQLIIYDHHGRIVNRLLNKALPAGLHNVDWKPGNLPAGIYVVQLRVNDSRAAKQMVHIR